MSLAEQVLALSNPQPVSFHPDVEVLEDETAAKVCDFTYEEEGAEKHGPRARRKRARAGLQLVEGEDPKYAGRVVSRKDLEAYDDGGSVSEGKWELVSHFVVTTTNN